MRKQLMTLTAGMLLLAASAAAQDWDARRADAIVDKLARFLPDASPWGFSPDPSHVSKGPASETVVNNRGSKYPALVTHKTWWFDDAELSRQLDKLRKEKEALKQEIDASLKEFHRVHGAEMEALKKAYGSEVDTLSKQAQDLVRQGKYDEARAVLD
jgi:hypothetical protein